MDGNRDIRLIFIDLDGTLLRNDGTPAPEGVRALRAAWGFKDPVIRANGGTVLAAPGGSVWAAHTIPMPVARAVSRLADRNGWEVSATVGETTYFRRRPGQKLGPLARPAEGGKTTEAAQQRLIVVSTNQEALVGEPVRMLVTQPRAIEAVGELAKQFPCDCRTEIYYRENGALHSLGIFARQADKGTALRLVAAKLGVQRSRTLAIGDNPNDVPMFTAAGASAATGNAPERVKRAATVVAPTNDEEGAAWAVHSFVPLPAASSRTSP